MQCGTRKQKTKHLVEPDRWQQGDERTRGAFSSVEPGANASERRFASRSWQFSFFLIQHARLVGGNHVLDVYECVVAAVSLERLQCFLNQVADILASLLAVVDLVAHVHCKAHRLSNPAAACVCISRKSIHCTHGSCSWRCSEQVEFGGNMVRVLRPPCRLTRPNAARFWARRRWSSGFLCWVRLWQKKIIK